MSEQRKLRDRFAHWSCNWILNHIATPWYRDMITGSILTGLEAAINREFETPAERTKPK